MLIRLVLALMVLHLISGNASAEKFRLLLPPFSGDPVGKNVSSFLNIEILKSFRINTLEKGRSIRRATINHKDLVLSNHSSAEGAGRRTKSDMVYWGKAFKYGDGVIVESSLTIPADKLPKGSFWVVKSPKAKAQLSIDLPNRYYEFKPFLLDRKIYKEYTDVSQAVVYTDRAFRTPVGKVGPVFRAISMEYESIKVKYQGKEGYIKYPAISEKPEGAINFINGIIRVLRGDRVRGKQSLLKVLDAQDVSREVQEDTRLFLGYLAFATKDYAQGNKYLREAYDINPYSVTVVKYYLTGLIAASLSPDGTPNIDVVEQVAGLLKQNEKLFEPGDTWLAACQKILEAGKQ
ncbi:hypothetical protein [Geotalea toluenoxydans]